MTLERLGRRASLCVTVLALVVMNGCSADDANADSGSQVERSESGSTSTSLVPPTGLTDPPPAGCMAERFPVLASVPSDTEVTTQAVGSRVAVRVGLPPAERPMRWVTVEIDPGSPFAANGTVSVGTERAPTPDTKTFTTRDGEVTALYSTNPIPSSSDDGDDVYRRLDWFDDELFISAQSLNVDLDEMLTIINELTLVPRTEFESFQVDHSLVPVCA
jgi:hypothetical protein